MSSAPYIIDQHLSDFLESDIALLVATSSNTNEPYISRGFGARVSDDCTKLTVFVTEIQSEHVLSNAQLCNSIAVNAARITSYESVQVKGGDVQLVELNRKDERHISNYLRDIRLEMHKVGVTDEQCTALFRSKDTQKIIGIQFTVFEAFHQTPGPGAGKPRPAIK